MKIGNREISPLHPPLVIAEIGINHGGDLDVAKNMVRLAALSGCECVKHQTHIVEDEMTDEAKKIFPPNANSVGNIDSCFSSSIGHHFYCRSWSLVTYYAFFTIFYCVW